MFLLKLYYIIVVSCCLNIIYYIDCCYVFPNDIPNPCNGVICRPGATCKPTADGKSANCHCPTHCPNYGDHTGSRPICATNAIDYPGDCEMRKAACESGNNITVKYMGKCDPCSTLSCTDPEVCQLDEYRKPSCKCGEPCPLEFAPVCATDGKTYSNECQMNREACRSKKALKIMFRGQCQTGDNPCYELQCNHGSECTVDYGRARCACTNVCEKVLRPVCGTDHQTYDNECELKRTACMSGSELKLAYNGPCGSAEACARRVCPFGGECTVINNRPVCKCQRCTSEFEPVCGSDGISYGNKCQLKLEACTHKRNIAVLYEGPCNGCEHKKCEHYSKCDSDGNSEARCLCPKKCDVDLKPEQVCGSDNNTYISLCELKNTSCNEKKLITIKHAGSCESCRGIRCPEGSICSRGKCMCSTDCTDVSYEPVCGTDKQTYPHECSLRREDCMSTSKAMKSITIAYYGECTTTEGDLDLKLANFENEIKSEHDNPNQTAACANILCSYEATCTIGDDGLPRCSCQFDCGSVNPAPVCASDFRLYPTLCHMKQESCRRQEELRLRPLDLCKGLEIKPCNGDEPLLDPSTGRPYDCGSGLHRKDCPAGSYCHQSSRVARCCRKEKPQTSIRTYSHSSSCGCNKLGAHDDTCDINGHCRCRPGVGGKKCDRCEPGYWGLTSKHRTGCIPCGCSSFGSVREDCEQMTGRCVCKTLIQGQKCTLCTNHRLTLGPNGCYDPDTTVLPSMNCDNLNCYSGASCTTRGGVATCTCPDVRCEPTNDDNPIVCGSDGRTYPSACTLKNEACTVQKDVVVQAIGSCTTHTELMNNLTLKNKHFLIPLLDIDSFITTQILKLSRQKFDILLEIENLCTNNGQILQSKGLSGDFINFEFDAFNTVFKWNLGSGDGRIHVNEAGIGRIKITLHRYKKDTIMILRKGSEKIIVKGQSQGNYTLLDSDGLMRIGHIEAGPNGKPRRSFIGCIHKLKIGTNTIIPTNSRIKIIESRNIRECTRAYKEATLCNNS